MILQNLKAFEKKYDGLINKYSFHFKECVLLAFNVIWDLCHEPDELLFNDKASSKSKQELKQNKIREMTVIIFVICFVSFLLKNKNRIKSL